MQAMKKERRKKKKSEEIFQGYRRSLKLLFFSLVGMNQL
jgi:hypothetical protein